MRCAGITRFLNWNFRLPPVFAARPTNSFSESVARVCNRLLGLWRYSHGCIASIKGFLLLTRRPNSCFNFSILLTVFLRGTKTWLVYLSFRTFKRRRKNSLLLHGRFKQAVLFRFVSLRHQQLCFDWSLFFQRWWSSLFKKTGWGEKWLYLLQKNLTSARAHSKLQIISIFIIHGLVIEKQHDLFLRREFITNLKGRVPLCFIHKLLYAVIFNVCFKSHWISFSLHLFLTGLKTSFSSKLCKFVWRTFLLRSSSRLIVIGC